MVKHSKKIKIAKDIEKIFGIAKNAKPFVRDKAMREFH